MQPTKHILCVVGFVGYIAHVLWFELLDVPSASFLYLTVVNPREHCAYKLGHGGISR